jgi:hypothetical protein
MKLLLVLMIFLSVQVTRKMESIFIDEKLRGFGSDEDEPLHPSTSSLELVLASTLEAEAP